MIDPLRVRPLYPTAAQETELNLETWDKAPGIAVAPPTPAPPTPAPPAPAPPAPAPPAASGSVWLPLGLGLLGLGAVVLVAKTAMSRRAALPGVS